jgi:hypothetical protein
MLNDMARASTSHTDFGETDANIVAAGLLKRDSRLGRVPSFRPAHPLRSRSRASHDDTP